MKQLVEVLEVFWWNFREIARKFWRNWEENFKWFQENYGNFTEKNWSNLKLMFLILRRNFRRFIWNNFSKIGNHEKTLKKYREHFADLKKNILMETSWTFLGNCCQDLPKILRKLQIISAKNCGRTSKKFWKSLERSWQSVQGRLQSLIRLWTAYPQFFLSKPT